MKPGPVDMYKSFLAMWEYEDSILGFSDILSKARTHFLIGKRTTINYLNRLLDDKVLEKKVSQDRRTYYKILDKKTYLKWKIKTLIDSLDDEVYLRQLSYELSIKLNCS